MSTITVLGAGLVGGLIARDLASDAGLSVVAVDAREEALAKLAGTARLTTRRADLSDPAEVARAAADADVVALAVPGFLGTAALRALIRAKKPVVDISFSPEDPLALDAEAKAAGVPVVVDCGVAPGLSNLVVGRAVAELDVAREVLILVGGLPIRRVWPFEYGLVFSLTDVLEEYTRPSRYRENGHEVVRPALSDPELVDLPHAGTLEAFNTDGLRTLLRTIDAPNLKEKTLRWPGHVEKMKVLREAGFLRDAPIRVGGVEVAPRAVTEAILHEAWRLPDGDEEFTILHVEVRGTKGGVAREIVWDLYDRTDPATRATSMARTTGFPCAIVARLVLEGAWSRPGVHPPEVLGRDASVTTRILRELAVRGVSVTRREA
ncbi:MAG: saccharopine dehydrogenase C-terminal domain-containing protein [bacterium]